MSPEVEAIFTFIETIRAAWGTAGWAGGLGAVFSGLVAVYRLSLVQRLLMWVSALHPKLRWVRYLVWGNWSTVTKILVVSIPLGLAGFLGTLATGGTWLVALGAAVTAIIGAMGTRTFVKKLVENPARGALERVRDYNQRKVSLKTKLPRVGN